MNTELSEYDLQSQTWKKLEQYLLVLTEKARIANDNLALSEVETAALRGELRAYRKILALGKPQPLINNE